jgi:hypothetical protein
LALRERLLALQLLALKQMKLYIEQNASEKPLECLQHHLIAM